MRHARSLVAILVIAGLALSTGTVLATPGVGFVRTPLGRATLGPFNVHTEDFKVQSKNPTDVVMARFTVDVGGHTGWHTHPGPTFGTITQGQFKLVGFTEKDGCTVHVYGPGQGFVESPNQPHVGINVGGDQVVGHVTFLNVPVGGAALDPSPAEPDCGAGGDEDEDGDD